LVPYKNAIKKKTLEQYVANLPAANKKAPILAATPKHIVLILHGINCMVSKIAIPLDIDPPKKLNLKEILRKKHCK
jgi:hypothetical protein